MLFFIITGRGICQGSNSQRPARYPESHFPLQPDKEMSSDDNTEDELPMPLTLQSLTLNDSHVCGFEANERHISSTIRHGVLHYKECEKGDPEKAEP